MKKLRPSFRRSKWTASVGLPATLAGIFLFVAAPAVHAGTGTVQTPHPPPWIPYELSAISLCLSGMNQESSNPQAALQTLQQARRDSTTAIAHGGGAVSVVLHNDYVIGQELMMAMREAAKAPENSKPTENQNQMTVANNRAVSVLGGNRVQASTRVRSSVK